jgi:hypothetical protein
MSRTRSLVATLLFCTVTAASAQVVVTDPWVRGTVAEQKATGMFARLTAPQASRLVSASSPVAGIVEIHEMAMEGSVMKMRAIPGLDLPAGKPVDLKPGGFHVMLMDLKQPLKAGESVPVTLVIESGGQRQTVEVKAAVRPLAHSPGGTGHKH